MDAGESIGEVKENVQEAAEASLPPKEVKKNFREAVEDSLPPKDLGISPPAEDEATEIK